MEFRRVLFRSYDSSTRSSGVMLSGSLASPRKPRSEEHTSELQSHDNLVCRLLLEKKKRRGIPAREEATSCFSLVCPDMVVSWPRCLLTVLPVPNCSIRLFFFNSWGTPALPTFPQARAPSV